MLIKNYSKWTYEYTDEDGNRFYRMWDRQNKQLTVLNLRHYKDDLMNMDHVNWEVWRSPSGCSDEDYAENNLEYIDCGIYGTGFVSCLNDAMNPTNNITHPTFVAGGYKLCKDPEFA